MINLEQFIDQDVTVTFENGNTFEGTIAKRDDKVYPVYPYVLRKGGREFWTYTEDGYTWKDKVKSSTDIKSIKSIKVKETSIQHQLNQESKIDEILSSLNSIEKKSLFIRLCDELM